MIKIVHTMTYFLLCGKNYRLRQITRCIVMTNVTIVLFIDIRDNNRLKIIVHIMTYFLLCKKMIPEVKKLKCKNNCSTHDNLLSVSRVRQNYGSLLIDIREKERQIKNKNK